MIKRWAPLLGTAVALAALPSAAPAWVAGRPGPILYSSAEGASSDAPGLHVWEINADGLGKRELTHGDDADPAWSPSGRVFVFSRRGSGDGLWRLAEANSSGGDVHTLTNPSPVGSDPSFGDHLPRFSPDGSKIAFVRSVGQGENVWVMNADGSQQHAVTDLAQQTRVEGLSWSPDGTKLVFLATPLLGTESDFRASVYEMTVTGALVHQAIAAGPYYRGAPDWSPAGLAQGEVFSGIHVFALDGIGTAGTYADSFAQNPSWAPNADGRGSASLAFLEGGVTSNELYTISTADPLAQELTFDGFVKQADSWGPAGPSFHPPSLGTTLEQPLAPGKRVIPVLIHCPGSAGLAGCRGTVTLRVPPHVLVSVRFKIKPGADRTVRLRLSRQTSAGLRAGRGLTLTLTTKLRGHTRRTVEHTRVLEPAALSARLASSSTQVGSPASLSGLLNLSQRGAGDAAAARKNVSFVALGPQGQVVAGRARASASGRYSESFDPTGAGGWVVQTVWNGDRSHPATRSRPLRLTVLRAPSKLSITCPGKATAGSPVSVSGALSPPTAGEPLTLYISHGKSTVSDNLTTTAGGAYSDSFTPTAPGNYGVQAVFGGDLDHTGSSSRSCGTVVNP